MVMVLPKGKYDYDLFPLTEEVVEINGEGQDIRREVFIDGVIEIPDDDLLQIRVSKRFADDLEALIDMTAEEVAEEDARRVRVDAPAQRAAVLGALAAMDYLTNKRVEGELDDREWQGVVDKRNELRRQLRRLESMSEG